MNRRTLAWVLAGVVTVGMAGCIAVSGPRADRAAAHEAASPQVTPHATASSPSPRVTHQPASPSPSPSHRKSTPSPGPITAASLGIPSAGKLKIPAWPAQKGMRWRGPLGSEGSTGTASVALTFDDGPGPYTSQILDVLDQYHVKATFCLIGRQIQDYQTVVRRMIADGMTLCNHSWDHDEALGTHSAQYIAANLQKTIDALHRVNAAATMAYFRNPGGNFTPSTYRVSELLGMRPLYWSVDTDDWTRPGVPAIEKTILTKTHRSSIVLMHDAGGDRTETIAALRAVLPQLTERFHLVALSTARTVAVDPGGPSPSASVAPGPTDGDDPSRP
jgi:peptidoglycan/xylan/chitin deacetylase (PgdA/CDA1 family)